MTDDPELQQPPCPAEDRLAWLAFAVTTLATAWCAAPANSWLDSGELVAAARTLGGVHPPGHPAWLSIAGLAELLPLGPYSLRLSWLSAFAAGASAWLLVAMLRESLAGRAPERGDAVWIAAGAVVLGGAGSLWQVGVRTEVYTLALASSLWCVWAALRARRLAGDGNLAGTAASLAEAAVALCLGLLNHHYVALFALPAAVVAGWPAIGLILRKRPKLMVTMLVCCAWLGVAYFALALRAKADVELRWGDPTTWRGLWDSVTARHFHKSVTTADVSIFDNIMVLFAMIVDGAGVALPATGLLGLIVGAIRRRPTATVGWLLLAGGLATKGIMRIDTHNPDDHGYVLAALAGLALGIAEFGFALPHVLQRRSVQVAAWAAVVAVLGSQIYTNFNNVETNLAELRAPEHCDSLARRAVAPGSLVLTNYFGVQFNEMAFRLAEGRRPDWQPTHLSMRVGDTDGGKGFGSWFAQHYPDLAVLAKAARYIGRPPVGNMLMMAEGQSVFAEMDPGNLIPAPYWEFNGLFNRLMTDRERALDYDVAQIGERQARLWQRLNERLGHTDRADHSTRMVLLWNHALQAAHALRRGWRELARDELGRARRVAPHDRLVGRLQDRLGTLDAAWKRSDGKQFANLWHRFMTYDFDALVGDAR